MFYQTLLLESANNIATIWLNRPEVHNAFNDLTISELAAVLKELEKDDALRVVVIRGKGKSFCAGADLNWMKAVKDYSYDENYQDSLNLCRLLYNIYTFPKPVIAVVHGSAIGGANGLLAACDIAICEENTTFSLSEVKIGLIPACISPYVIKRVGEPIARELMLTGKRIKGPEAEKHKLVNRSLPESELENYLNETLNLLLSSGPKAVENCKKLIFDVVNTWTLDQTIENTATLIAKQRLSDEAQEGMIAFLEKRKPVWNVV
ncbi:MAG: enoyl-CoA hydratase/isomerase family protein [Bacteroidales bacterium]|nr:enoyl-CoA hydratase/isomerase family protein [Bacteroidales bacterium]